jgi:hypothetical protein
MAKAGLARLINNFFDINLQESEVEHLAENHIDG